MLFKDHKKFQFKIFADEEKSDVFIFSHVDFHFHSQKNAQKETSTKQKKVKNKIKILYSSIIEQNLHNLTIKDFFLCLFSYCHLLAASRHTLGHLLCNNFFSKNIFTMTH